VGGPRQLLHLAGGAPVVGRRIVRIDDVAEEISPGSRPAGDGRHPDRDDVVA
jgi:hypothetical protein